jgi:hypothetical protein
MNPTGGTSNTITARLIAICPPLEAAAAEL